MGSVWCILQNAGAPGTKWQIPALLGTGCRKQGRSQGIGHRKDQKGSCRRLAQFSVESVHPNRQGVAGPTFSCSVSHSSIAARSTVFWIDRIGSEMGPFDADGDRSNVTKSDFYLHADNEEKLRETLKEFIGSSEGRTLSEIREHLEISRKYAVPICEYLDESQFTKRNGDVRVLV